MTVDEPRREFCERGGAAGLLGLATTTFGLGAAFLPTSDVTSVALFETKLVIGIVGPTALGWYLFKRSQRDRLVAR